MNINELKSFENWTSYELNLAFIIIYGTLVFPILLFIPGPFGKFFTKGWGPQINGKLGWFVFESVPWVFFSYWFLQTPVQELTVPSLILYI
ncbi:hypothetical protein HDV05_008827, partial [Chytridiales sp. JEL 0842]